MYLVEMEFYSLFLKHKSPDHNLILNTLRIEFQTTTVNTCDLGLY